MVPGQAGEQAVVVGVVGKPVGLRGEALVRPDPDVGEAVLVAGRRVLAGPPANRSLEIVHSRLQSGRRVVQFMGVDTREAAEALRGAVLMVPRSQIALEDDAVWTSDLLGREVVDQSGAVVGILEAVADGAAHDYLVIARPDGGEILVPAVPELVELAADRIIVRAIPGLLDGQE